MIRYKCLVVPLLELLGAPDTPDPRQAAREQSAVRAPELIAPSGRDL